MFHQNQSSVSSIHDKLNAENSLLENACPMAFTGTVHKWAYPTPTHTFFSKQIPNKTSGHLSPKCSTSFVHSSLSFEMFVLFYVLPGWKAYMSIAVKWKLLSIEILFQWEFHNPQLLKIRKHKLWMVARSLSKGYAMPLRNGILFNRLQNAFIFTG